MKKIHVVLADDHRLFREGLHALLDQIDVLKVVAESYSNGEIAEKLIISVRTVNAHKNNIMRKLHLKSNVDIVKYALVNRMIKL